MKDRYTVAEYANLMGVSTQAIYKQRNTKLKGRYIKENGVSYVLADTTQNQPTTNQELPLRGKSQEQPTNQPENQPTTNQQQTNQNNQEFIQFLLKQIEIKDKQIEELQKHNNLLAHNMIQGNYIEAHDKGLTLMESETNETAKRKKHKGLFARFKKERI